MADPFEDMDPELRDTADLVRSLSRRFGLSPRAVLNAGLRVCRLTDLENLPGGIDRNGPALFEYELGRQGERVGNRTALKLLRSFLDADQLAQLERSRRFDVRVGDRTYRLVPNTGAAWRVERHGKRWRTTVTYCLHEEDEAERLPAGDRTLAHLLLLVNDEAEFLRLANATPRRA